MIQVKQSDLESSWRLDELAKEHPALTENCLAALREFRLTDELRSSLPGIGPRLDGFDDISRDEYHALFNAWLRQEIRGECDCDADGYTKHMLDVDGIQISILLNGEGGSWGRGSARHVTCYLRKHFNPSATVNAQLAARFRRQTLHNLTIWPKSPVSADKQQEAIANIPRTLPPALRGWLLVGPPGTSKSTYATAAIRDWLTDRMFWELLGTQIDFAHKTVRYESAFYVAKVPDWIDAMQSWEHRDFDDPHVQRPSLTPRAISDDFAETGICPILLLEEVDKFTATEKRRNLLFRLVDAVYQADGVIVTTANCTKRDLEEVVGEAVYRRLAGTNDLDEAYMVWDFFFATSKTGRQK